MVQYDLRNCCQYRSLSNEMYELIFAHRSRIPEHVSWYILFFENVTAVLIQKAELQYTDKHTSSHIFYRRDTTCSYLVQVVLLQNSRQKTARIKLVLFNSLHLWSRKSDVLRLGERSYSYVWRSNIARDISSSSSIVMSQNFFWTLIGTSLVILIVLPRLLLALNKASWHLYYGYIQSILSAYSLKAPHRSNHFQNKTWYRAQSWASPLQNRRACWAVLQIFTNFQSWELLFQERFTTYQWWGLVLQELLIVHCSKLILKVTHHGRRNTSCK